MSRMRRIGGLRRASAIPHKDSEPPRFGRPEVIFRDQQTLELRQFYQLPTREELKVAYTLDAYFFFPRSFGITPQTWSRDVFYRNSNILTRLHAPGLSLRLLQDVNHPANPAHVLTQHMNRLMYAGYPGLRSMTALAQIFGTELTDAVRAETRQLNLLIEQCCNRRPDSNTVDELWTGIDKLIGHCSGGLAALRRVRAMAQAYQAITPPNLLSSLNFAEEYTAAVVDESLSSVALSVNSCRGLYSGDCMNHAVCMRLATALEELNNRRRAQGFVVPRRSDAEYYSYRLGLLKKELQRSLYVNTRALNTDSFYANSAAMVGAGLAATWAALAQIPLVTNMMKDAPGGIVLASSLGIGAYVLKDRIKDLVRARLSRHWNRWDHANEIAGESLTQAGLGAFGGHARERFRWLDEHHVPEEVLSLRRRERTVRGLSTELEQVFHYQRSLSVEPAEAKASDLPAGYGIEEMLRLNLDDILRRLDDPQHNVSFYTGGGTFRTLAMPKVYHLNVVVVARSDTYDITHIIRSRVVLNKHRLLRIEKIRA